MAASPSFTDLPVELTIALGDRFFHAAEPLKTGFTPPTLSRIKFYTRKKKQFAHTPKGDVNELLDLRSTWLLGQQRWG